MIRTPENTLPSPTIQGKCKNTLREKQETAIWQRAGNSAFISKQKLSAYGRQNPVDRKNFYSNLSRHHYSRFFTHVPDDTLSSAVIWTESRMLWRKGGKRVLLRPDWILHAEIYFPMPRCPHSSLSCTQWRKSTISIILFIRSILFLFLLKTKESTTCNH